MSGLDIAIAIVLLVGAISGYRDGFLMSLFSLLAVILGVLGAFKLMGMAMIYLNDHFEIDKEMLPYIAFAVVFVLIVVAVMLLGRLLKLSVDKSFLGRVDQVAGAGLGIIKTLFMVSVVLWILDSLHVKFPQHWRADSVLAPRVEPFAQDVTAWIATFFPPFSDIF